MTDLTQTLYFHIDFVLVWHQCPSSENPNGGLIALEVDKYSEDIQRRTGEQANPECFSGLLADPPQAFDYNATSSVLTKLVPIGTNF